MSTTKLVGEIDRELHDLCQPLTRLSLMLELGQVRGDAESLRDAVRTSMGECKQVCEGVTRMRLRLLEMVDAARESL